MKNTETQAGQTVPLDSTGSLYSCKICGLKPHPFDDGDVGAVKFMCECGTSGAWAKTTNEARIRWNKIAFCPNWNAEND